MSENFYDHQGIVRNDFIPYFPSFVAATKAPSNFGTYFTILRKASSAAALGAIPFLIFSTVWKLRLKMFLLTVLSCFLLKKAEVLLHLLKICTSKKYGYFVDYKQTISGQN